MKHNSKANIVMGCLVWMMVGIQVVCTAKADGWFWSCSLYFEQGVSSHCQIVGSSCEGGCRKYGLLPGTSDCGYCASTWNPLAYCKNTTPPRYQTYAILEAACEWAQVSHDPEDVVWECSCGANWNPVGTLVNGCYCP